jgi:hypothetical protein
MSSTLDGTPSVAWYSGPLVLSVVNTSRLANGSHVEPSIVARSLPFASLSAISVTRWPASASRLIRVM